MNWRFTLIDRNDIEHVIDEPLGWDAIVINVKRDTDKHGVVADYQENDFEFYGLAHKLIKQEYDAYGVQGNMVMVIEEACDDVYDELYRGRLLFGNTPYFSSGLKCFVRIAIATSSDITTFLNSFEQKVNLLTNKGFDEKTNLLAYQMLGYNLQLPSKGILLQNKAENEAELQASVFGAVNDCSSPIDVFEGGQLEFPFSKIFVGEIGGFSVPSPSEEFYAEVGGTCIPFSDDAVTVPGTEGNLVWPVAPIVNYAEGFPGFGNIGTTTDVETEFKVKGKITFTNATAHGIQIVFFRLDQAGNAEWIWDHVVNSYTTPQPAPHEFTYDQTYSGTLKINSGDRFFFYLIVNHQKTTAQCESDTDAYKLTFDQSNYFRMSALSHTPVTITKAFMVNEAFSRIAEAISNDRIRVYSDYYGRTDSEPYAHDTDGCGSLKSITQGLFIRRQEQRNGNAAAFALSLQDMWEGLEPIDHIGYGLEPDDHREGYLRFRIEPWKFFYKDTVIMSCTGVNTIEKTAIENEHYSTFKFGYDKWEAEEYNGLDEILTKREYRTTIDQVKQDLSKLSTFVSSGYAWEITRRKGNTDSKDWRFDNDTFIVCNARGNTVSLLVSYTDDGVGLWGITEVPAWAVAGSMIDIVAQETDEGGNEPIPDNTGTFEIVSASVVSGAVFIQTNPGFATFRLFAGAKITSSSINSIQVEIGNVTNPLNIIDPGTLYNYRITPLRNALRWTDKIFSGYRTQGAANKIIFTKGEGNYFAKGEMTSGVCKWENQAIAENETITELLFSNSEKFYPKLRPERVKYEYPMSLSEFKFLLANPYGVIEYDSGSERGEGWIDVVKYKPEKGLASFTLIPKYQ